MKDILKQKLYLHPLILSFVKRKFFIALILLGGVCFSAFTPPAKAKKVKWAKVLPGREYVQQLNPKADPRYGYYDYIYFDEGGKLLMKLQQTLHNCTFVLNEDTATTCNCPDVPNPKVFKLYHIDTLVDEKGIKWIYKPDESE